MSEKQPSRQRNELATLVEQLRHHGIGRRTFLMKAAAAGVAMSTASALATDVLAAAEGRPTAQTPAPARVTIRVPSNIPISREDLVRISDEFNSKLIEIVRRRAGAGLTPVTKEIEQVKVSEIGPSGEPYR